MQRQLSISKLLGSAEWRKPLRSAAPARGAGRVLNVLSAWFLLIDALPTSHRPAADPDARPASVAVPDAPAAEAPPAAAADPAAEKAAADAVATQLAEARAALLAGATPAAAAAAAAADAVTERAAAAALA